MRSNTCRVRNQDFKNSQEVRDFTDVTLVQRDSNISIGMCYKKDNRSHLKSVHMKGTILYETNRNVFHIIFFMTQIHRIQSPGCPQL